MRVFIYPRQSASYKHWGQLTLGQEEAMRSVFEPPSTGLWWRPGGCTQPHSWCSWWSNHTCWCDRWPSSRCASPSPDILLVWLQEKSSRTRCNYSLLIRIDTKEKFRSSETVSDWSNFVLTVQAGETEHANLLCYVVPGPWCPQSFEFSFQLSPHQ